MIRKRLTVLLVAVLTATGLVASAPESDAAARAPAALDVLFVGNSLLGTRGPTGEDTPAVVRQLAQATGRSVRVVEAIRFGSTLQRTWDTGPARIALTGSARYDVIVLQEYSTLVTTDLAQVRSTLLRTYAPVLRRALKPGGRVLLFENWALAGHAPFRTRAANVAAIDAGYAQLAGILPVPTTLAPIGDEFEAVIKRSGIRTLILPDGKHPTGQADYLDAATLYGLIFRCSPRTLPDLYVSAPMARRLRDVAATALGR